MQGAGDRKKQMKEGDLLCRLQVHSSSDTGALHQDIITEEMILPASRTTAYTVSPRWHGQFMEVDV